MIFLMDSPTNRFFSLVSVITENEREHECVEVGLGGNVVKDGLMWFGDGDDHLHSFAVAILVGSLISHEAECPLAGIEIITVISE